MSRLYSTLPPKIYTLGQFVHQAEVLYGLDQDTFLNFVLTGQNTLDDAPHQAVVDPTRNRIHANDRIFGSRDYDSFLGAQANIAVKSDISIYPASNPADTLTTSIHLKRAIPQGNTTISTPYHRIPNLQLGIFGVRHMLHVFFPTLFTEGRSSGPCLTKDERAVFYECGLRPAIQALIPWNVQEWPATLDDELFRAKKRSGALSFQSKMIPAFAVPHLMDHIRQQLEENDIEWGNDCFVLHTVRGTKQASKHSKTEAAATLALEEYLESAQISLDSIDSEGEWWIDVGLEFSSREDYGLHWTTTSHFHIVKEVLRISEAHASRITTLGSSKYSRDITNHLPAVSGCRIEPGVQAEGPYSAAYCQLYVSEKALTYHPERGHHGKAITMQEAMGKTQPSAFVLGLYNLFQSARTHTSASARIELRVPFRYATKVLLQIDPSVVKESLLAFTRHDWWSFRQYRLFALSGVLIHQAQGRSELRVRRDALLLTASIVWLINSIHARPDDGPASRNLMDAVLPVTDGSDPDQLTLIFTANRRGDGHEEEEEGDDQSPSIPYNPWGVIFLRTIMFQDVPRMRAGGPSLSNASFKFFFGKTEEEIYHTYYRVGILAPAVVAETRVVTNKSKRTPTYVSFAEAAEPVLFNLAERNHTLPPPAVDSGSDMEVEDEPPEDNMGIDEKISQLYRQFLIDIMNKTPNPKGVQNASYCVLSHGAKLSVTEELFKNPRLPDVWRACQYKIGSVEDFNTAFNHLFPPRGHKTSQQVQGYLQCQYYMKWKEICATANAATTNAIRHEIKKRLNSFFWLPHACQDKLWPTTHISPFVHYPPGSSPNAPAPRILVRREPQI